MFKRLVNAITGGFLGGDPAKAGQPRAISVVEKGVSEHLNPGAPFVESDGNSPVPRWPEFGAAMVSASPDELLATQTKLIDKLLESTPLSPVKFKELIVPALARYASWVHLLPASEQHHHFGPGGLLRHGLEVAVHAARMADGKQVGMDLVPSERNLYSPRWKVAAMFGGLLHDIGKPLVDCGATDPNRTATWPAQAGPLYEWLTENQLSHYRIYWRSGARHERHKAIGTSVAREILGKDLLRWLSEEPTHEVVDLMMLSIAQGRTSGNLMSQIVSKADSLSVEEDLKQLAKRTQSSGQGGSVSNCSRIISELRDVIESGKMAINKPGEPLWWTTEGLFAIYPRVLDEVLPKLVAKQIPGIPASKTEIASILVETGFLVAAEAETVDGKQTSTTWDLHITMEAKGEAVATHKIRVIRFADHEVVVGNRPLPLPVKAEAKAPFVDVGKIDKNLEAVKVLSVDESASTDPANPAPSDGARAPAQDASPAQQASPSSLVPSIEVTGGSQGGKNVRDFADARSAEKAIARDKRGIPNALTLEQIMERLQAAGMEGAAIAEVFDRIRDARMGFNEDYTETLDGLAVRYPEGFEGLGIPASDLMTSFAQKSWLVIESGSDRKINERAFGDNRRKCLIFTGLAGKAWEAIKKDDTNVLTARKRPAKVEQRAPEPAAKPEPSRATEADARRQDKPRQQQDQASRSDGRKPQGSAQRPAPAPGADDRALQKSPQAPTRTDDRPPQGSQQRPQQPQQPQQPRPDDRAPQGTTQRPAQPQAPRSEDRAPNGPSGQPSQQQAQRAEDRKPQPPKQEPVKPQEQLPDTAALSQALPSGEETPVVEPKVLRADPAVNILNDPPKPNEGEKPSVNTSSIVAKTISDLTPTLTQAIKSAARMTLERDLLKQGILLTEATPDQIKHVLLEFGDRNGVAHAPLGYALLEGVPLIFAPMPPMYSFAAIEEPRLNAAFPLSEEDRKRLDGSLARIRASQKNTAIPTP